MKIVGTAIRWSHASSRRTRTHFRQRRDSAAEEQIKEWDFFWAELLEKGDTYCG
ncbi:MAG TPA: hypothetical protein VFP87_09490 [Chitinophagaceae bacterium]|nr:hypothetical protein [Chitinophagaceae bacterium]